MYVFLVEFYMLINYLEIHVETKGKNRQEA